MRVACRRGRVGCCRLSRASAILVSPSAELRSPAFPDLCLCRRIESLLALQQRPLSPDDSSRAPSPDSKCAVIESSGPSQSESSALRAPRFHYLHRLLVVNDGLLSRPSDEGPMTGLRYLRHLTAPEVSCAPAFDHLHKVMALGAAGGAEEGAMLGLGHLRRLMASAPAFRNLHNLLELHAGLASDVEGAKGPMPGMWYLRRLMTLPDLPPDAMLQSSGAVNERGRPQRSEAEWRCASRANWGGCPGKRWYDSRQPSPSARESLAACGRAGEHQMPRAAWCSFCPTRWGSNRRHSI